MRLAWLALALAACAAPAVPATSAAGARASLMERTNAAAACGEAARNHDRPFVVEWDATDLASFEAKAARDAIFVRYDGCAIEVLYGCADAQVPGRFGRYAPPVWTSGTLQGFEVRDEGELYARLPLGAAALGGRVRAGQALALRYFVSGVATSTREALWRGELAAQPACARATHFVWSYNLGAFVLAAAVHASAEAKVGAGAIGAGGEGRHEEESLGQGGRLASCTTQDQRACRVPIRLSLRRIEEGEHPAGPGAAPIVAAGVPVAAPPDFESSPAGQAQAASREALARFEARDGEGCLRALDRALALDPRLGDGLGQTRARCLMLAGRCEDGMRDLRALLAALDARRARSDEDLDREVRVAANGACASAGAKSDADFVVRASRELHEAAAAKDAGRCRASFEAIAPRVAKLPRTPEAMQAANGGKMALDEGALCLARAGRCDEGLALYRRSYALKLPGMSGVDAIATQAWGTIVAQQKIACATPR